MVREVKQNPCCLLDGGEAGSFRDFAGVTGGGCHSDR